MAVALAGCVCAENAGPGGVTDCEPFTRVPESNVLDETKSC